MFNSIFCNNTTFPPNKELSGKKVEPEQFQSMFRIPCSVFRVPYSVFRGSCFDIYLLESAIIFFNYLANIVYSIKSGLNFIYYKRAVLQEFREALLKLFLNHLC